MEILSILPDDNYYFRLAIDSMVPNYPTANSTNMLSNALCGNMGSNGLVNLDEKGMPQKSDLFTSLEKYGKLTDHDRKKLTDLSAQIDKIQKKKEELIANKDKDKKTTMEASFNAAGLDPSKLTDTEKKEIDVNKIIAKLNEAKDQKRKELEETQKKLLGEESEVALYDKNFNNIDATELSRLNDLTKEADTYYDKLTQVNDSIKEIEDNYNTKADIIKNNQGVSSQQKNTELNKLAQERSKNSKLTKLLKQKSELTVKLAMARSKAEKYGEKAIEDDKTIDIKSLKAEKKEEAK